LLEGRGFRTLEETRAAVFEYVEIFIIAVVSML
jgi:hypothetical protein